MELTELEMQKDIKLSKVDKTQSKYDQMFMKSFENTSIQDKIYAKYNIRTLELMNSVRHYGLDKDSDVAALRNKNKIERGKLLKTK